MKIIRKIREMQAEAEKIRINGGKIAVVPTMGFLHEGHMSLVDIAKKHADHVIVTIFVNPTQFAPTEDLDKYPKDFKRDCELCESRKVDAIFNPDCKEMYPGDSSVWVVEERLSKGLCGRTRPTHFRGVTTVVAKLFNATLPHFAIFGEKDYQQAAIIRKMVRDLDFPVKIITGPVVRESDGLAMSSRNKYLSPDEREKALSISKALQEARQKILRGERAAGKIIGGINLRISQNGGRVDYVEIIDSETLEPLKKIDGKAVIAVAAFFGTTRLIDNISV